MHRSIAWLACLTALLLVTAGCGGCGAPSQPVSPTGNNGEGDGDKDPSDTEKPSGPFKFADLIQPFEPPKLEELEKTVEWEDRPVQDSLALLREKQKGETPQL